MSANGDITLTIHKGKTHRSAHSPEHSFASDEEDSSGTGVHIPPPATDDAEFSDQDNLTDDDYTVLSSKGEVGPSESASRLSSQPDARLPQTRRRPSRREVDHHPRRNNRLTRARRQPHHSPEESEVGSHEDLLYGDDGPPYMPAPPRPRPPQYNWPPHHGGPGHPYDPREQRDPRYHPSGGYQQYPPPGDQLMRVRNGFNGGPQYGMQQYQQPGSPPVQSPYYNGSHPGMHGSMAPPMGPHAAGYGPDMMHHPQFMQPGMQNMPHGLPGQAGYFPQFPPAQNPFVYQQAPQIIQAPPQIQYVPVPTASPVQQPPSAKSTTPAPAEAAKTPPAAHAAPAPAPAAPAPPPPPPEPPKPDPGIEELKKMLLQERKDREEREAKQKAEEEARIKKAADDKKKAEEIAAAAKAAAAKAKDEAEKKAAEEKEKAAKKAAEEAAAIKAEAEEAMKKAAVKAAEDAAKAKEEHEAALAAAQVPPPAEKQKPIRFKDAVGRKFNFPFHLCATWEGMEDLIKQAFLHVDVIGQHVAEGHYDLIGPNSEIILPAVWETVIEPDWAITMHMWPIPEPEPEPAPPDVLLDPLPADILGLDLGKKKGKDKKKDKAKAPAPPPMPANIEVIGPPPPPPPIAPLAGPGAVLDGPTGPKNKKKPSSGWSLFGGPPKPKAKPKAGPKKAG